MNSFFQTSLPSFQFSAATSPYCEIAKTKPAAVSMVGATRGPPALQHPGVPVLPIGSAQTREPSFAFRQMTEERPSTSPAVTTRSPAVATVEYPLPTPVISQTNLGPPAGQSC